MWEKRGIYNDAGRFGGHKESLHSINSFQRAKRLAARCLSFLALYFQCQKESIRAAPRASARSGEAAGPVWKVSALNVFSLK